MPKKVTGKRPTNSKTQWNKKCICFLLIYIKIAKNKAPTGYITKTTKNRDYIKAIRTKLTINDMCNVFLPIFYYKKGICS